MCSSFGVSGLRLVWHDASIMRGVTVRRTKRFFMVLKGWVKLVVGEVGGVFTDR